MTCKYKKRRSNWTSNISCYSDSAIMNGVQCNRAIFGTGRYAGNHDLNVWRQIYEAEARKRGLLKGA